MFYVLLTLAIKNEKVMKMKSMFIYRYNNSCTDTEEAAYGCFIVA